MFDLIGEVLELLLSCGGVPGPNSLQGQRRARLGAAVVASIVIGLGSFWSGSFRVHLAMLLGGFFVAVWVAAFSVVDVAKESPDVPWLSVVAILIAGASVTVGVALAFHSV